MRVTARMKIVDHEKIAAIGEIVIDGLVVIHDVKYVKVEKKDGKVQYAVLLPNRKVNDEWVPVMRITDKSLWEDIRQAVFESIKEELDRDTIHFKQDTDIRLYNGEADLKAYATVVINDAVEIRNIRIKEKDGKEKVVFPFRMTENGAESIVGPVSRFTYDIMEGQILEAYHDAVKAREFSLEKPERGGAYERNK